MCAEPVLNANGGAVLPRNGAAQPGDLCAPQEQPTERPPGPASGAETGGSRADHFKNGSRRTLQTRLGWPGDAVKAAT